MKRLVVDTETGGLDAATHSILSVGMVGWNDGALESELEVMVNEGAHLSVEDQALAVNGLTREEIAKGMTPEVAVHTIAAFLAANGLLSYGRGRIEVGGHNPGFGVAFLA